MVNDPAGFRPKSFPPPEFPPRKLPPFARMPPAVFPSVMGLLGLALALFRALETAGLPTAPAELAMGLVAGLWVFCVAGYARKLSLRPGVVRDDLAILPGRAGLAAGSVSAFLTAAILATFAPSLAKVFLPMAFALHALIVVLIIRALLRAPEEARGVTPVWHLVFVGPIVGALAAVPLGWTTLASLILWGTIPLALGIWAASARHLLRRIPPAPLRPLLAIHLAPASLFASVAGLLGYAALAQICVALGALIFLGLLVRGRWITEAGFSALWGAFTFPLAAFATALLVNGWDLPGVAITACALGVNVTIAVRVLRMWPKGTLATKTNAATA